jgi:ribosome maturation factor RimP
MERETRVQTLIEPTVEDMGFEVVRVRVSGTVRPVLEVMAEPSDGSPMTVEGCASISRAISAVLDVEDPISSAYTLEVSSPGVDRPLTRPKDFDRFAGFDAKVELQQPVDGQRRYSGRLGGLDDQGHVIVGEGEAQVRVPLADVRRAKLIMTDALLAAFAEDQPGQNGEG